MNLKLKEAMINLKKDGGCIICFSRECVCKPIKSREVRMEQPETKTLVIKSAQALGKSESGVVFNRKEGRNGN